MFKIRKQMIFGELIYYFGMFMKIQPAGYFYVAFINHEGLVGRSILVSQLMEKKY